MSAQSIDLLRLRQRTKFSEMLEIVLFKPVLWAMF